MTTPENTRSEGQTARDVFPEDEGLPDVQQDDFPTMRANEDPEFAPLPRETPGASADFGTTAFEQSQGESLTRRLEREMPDGITDVRPAEDADHARPQLEQDLDTGPDTGPDTDSGTGRTADDLEATADQPPEGGGLTQEEAAIHPID